MWRNSSIRPELLLFAFTLLLSATLLFTVQPMFGKMILPMFGGSPSVWLTALVLFQLMLLAGYAYVYGSITWLGIRKQAALHLLVLLLPLLVLPVRVLTGWIAISPTRPLASVSWTLIFSIGLPFFALSASAPLLQRWFATTNDPAASDPYFLYAASNLGSLGGLLAYPLLIEPLSRLSTQSHIWTIGYVVLVALIIVCASRVWRVQAVPKQAKPKRDAMGAKATPVSRAIRLRWLALAAVPASLLVSVTSYVTTDFAVPLFWIAPLATYLATFVLVFARRPILSHRLMSILLPFAVVVPLILAAGQVHESLTLLVFPLVALFVAAMVCHGELAASRPEVRHLTEFYLWLSLGGAIGGLFNVLIAPLIFKTTAEYPLGLLLACLIPATAPARQVRRKPIKAARSRRDSREHWLTLGIAVALGLLVLGLAFPAARLRLPSGTLRFVGVVFALPAIIALWFRRNRVRFAAGLSAILLAGAFYSHLDRSIIARARSFYGVYFVANHGEYRVLVHGTTNHGAQSLLPQAKCIPLSYYFPTGPLGHLFRSFQGEQAKSDIAVVGLGAGSTAGYAQPGQRWTFYEIDPTVERIARDPQYFTLLRDCAPQAQVILGDARVSLANEPDGTHDVIILDAFSSDAIPLHLLTREALDLYLRKLSPHGVLAFHITNRYFDLRPVLSRLARDAHLVAYLQSDFDVTPAEARAGKEGSQWVVMARRPEDLGGLLQETQWMASLPNITGTAWTDDYSNVLGALVFTNDLSF
ncbi:MAG TPA: fused MFS/spermidine synthase [Candidatus Udaeobacter sp.]